MDTGPIVNLFTQLLTAGAAVAAAACAFFVMLAGYQYMTAGGSTRAIQSAKGCRVANPARAQISDGESVLALLWRLTARTTR